MPSLPRVRQRALHQRKADPAVAERRLDRERPEQQRRRLPDPHRREPHRADQQRADARGEGQSEIVPDALADAVGGARIAPGTEGALVQPLDRQGVVFGFRQDGDGEIGHSGAG